MVYRGRAQTCRQSIRIPKEKFYQDAIAKTLLAIYNNLSLGHATNAAFIDIKQSFDLIDINIVLDMLMQTKAPYTYIKIIWELTFERKYRFYFDERITHQEILHTGISQDSVLSSLIFNLYLSNINQVLKQYFQYNLFVDDLARHVRDDNKKKLV